MSGDGAFVSVGGAIHRDYPKPELIPDPVPPPKGAAEGYPAGLRTRESPLGLIYTDGEGRTVYALRSLSGRWRGEPAEFCVGPCTQMWKALAAPANAKPIGAWNVVTGPQGPQWAYGRAPVFTFRGDRNVGEINGHEFDDVFLAINYIPSPPKVQVPPSVDPVFVEHRRYAMADKGKRLLYGYSSQRDCATWCEALDPYLASLLSKDIGEWKVVRTGDRRQWSFGGKLVYVSRANSLEVTDPKALITPRRQGPPTDR